MSLRVLTQQYSVLLLVTLGAVVTAFVTHSIVFMLALALFGGLYLVAQQESIHSSRLLRRFTLSAVILFVSVGSFNYVINPLGLYPPRFFNPDSVVLTNRQNAFAACLSHQTVCRDSR
ncbi:MAG: hypothetical protein R3E39_17560 [Anaerolineae bacterium]